MWGTPASQTSSWCVSPLVDILGNSSLLKQKNARTRLSLVYDNCSALENMHYHFLLRVMKAHGLTRLFEEPNHGQSLRKLLFQTIIATDMSVHGDFMQRFQKVVDGEHGSLCMRQVIVAQAILKNADISNPVCIFCCCLRCTCSVLTTLS